MQKEIVTSVTDLKRVRERDGQDGQEHTTKERETVVIFGCLLGRSEARQGGIYTASGTLPVSHEEIFWLFRRLSES